MTPDENAPVESAGEPGPQRRRFKVDLGETHELRAAAPLTWGKSAWVVDGVLSPEPAPSVDDPDRAFLAVVRLCPLDGALPLPDKLSPKTLAAGDSNFRLPASTEPRHMHVNGGSGRLLAVVTLIANDHGRLASIWVEVPAAKNSTIAYRVARTVFNNLQMQLAFEQELSIRESAVAVWEVGSDAFVMRFGMGYPELDFDLAGEAPSTIMQRLLAPYADALHSNSPYYSFLLFFSLLEFMLNSWTGAVRSAYERRGASLPRRSHIADFDDLFWIAPTLHGKSYQEILTMSRHLRNRAGGGHFDFAIGPRVLSVVADDEIACIRDVFRIILKRVLLDARCDVKELLTLGAEESALANELQEWIVSRDGHKRQKSRGKQS